MKTKVPLTQFTIPTPCPMDWDRMSGDERVRHCEACGKDVHDLTAMSPDEIVTLLSPVREDEEEPCARAWRSPDGTLVASGSRPPHLLLGRWQFNLRSLLVFIAWSAAILGFTRWMASMPVVVAGGIRRRPPGVTSGPGSSVGNAGATGTTTDEYGAEECAADVSLP